MAILVHTGRHGEPGVNAQPHVMVDSDHVAGLASMVKLEVLAAKEVTLMLNHAILNPVQDGTRGPHGLNAAPLVDKDVFQDLVDALVDFREILDVRVPAMSNKLAR